jgi:Helicase associated domain
MGALLQSLTRLHLNIPVGYTTPDGVGLGRWACTQRKLRSAKVRGKSTDHSISSRRIQRLEAIGFPWRLPLGGSRIKQQQQQQQHSHPAVQVHQKQDHLNEQPPTAVVAAGAGAAYTMIIPAASSSIPSQLRDSKSVLENRTATAVKAKESAKQQRHRPARVVFLYGPGEPYYDKRLEIDNAELLWDDDHEHWQKPYSCSSSPTVEEV